VAIAMAIACQPRLLIADEPTTALDVTVQAQIMALLLKLQREQQMALLLITHDLGLVAENAQRVSVMYAGQIVESGAVAAVFAQPQHPYTEALLAALPERHRHGERLASLPGMVPAATARPSGCLLAPRCPYAQPACQQRPELFARDGRRVRCFFPRGDA
jgi:dipeptide transport system ATP-binding protein